MMTLNLTRRSEQAPVSQHREKIQWAERSCNPTKGSYDMHPQFSTSYLYHSLQMHFDNVIRSPSCQYRLSVGTPEVHSVCIDYIPEAPS